ncbi:MAG: pyrroline-5-carboxylate reductase [Rhizobiaceae bacterium]|nr:pyrroline-5-carboxylate reductase [Rhizobiaceae bacterium]
MAIKVVLVGCGNMGYAMLAGWLKSGHLKPADVLVVEPADALRERAAMLGVSTGTSADAIPSQTSPQLIVLAVKPQVIRAVTTGYKRFADGGTIFLSVAAGTSTATLSQSLGDTTPIARCMPNTPAAIGKGMMVVYANPHVPEAGFDFVKTLLATSGAVAEINDEGLMDAVTAVSGSGPAYVFHFIECLTDAGVSAGLPLETSKLLAMQTVFGAASLAAESSEEPGKLREQVTSPNGTTAAALNVLMGDERLKNLIGEAVEAARLRSEELGRD